MVAGATVAEGTTVVDARAAGATAGGARGGVVPVETRVCRAREAAARAEAGAALMAKKTQSCFPLRPRG